MLVGLILPLAMSARTWSSFFCWSDVALQITAPGPSLALLRPSFFESPTPSAQTSAQTWR